MIKADQNSDFRIYFKFDCFQTQIYTLDQINYSRHGMSESK